jgi:hypothetical protein
MKLGDLKGTTQEQRAIMAVGEGRCIRCRNELLPNEKNKSEPVCDSCFYAPELPDDIYVTRPGR